MTLEEIIAKSPNIKSFGGGKWAIYSVACCWWTSFPADFGKHPKGLPCCPHCCGMLMQAPLEDFIDMAKAHPHHYGKGGLANLIAAYSRNAKTCYEEWEDYR